MSLKLLTEHHLEFLSLNGGYVQAHLSLYTCQNATLFEITCHGLIIFLPCAWCAQKSYS